MWDLIGATTWARQTMLSDIFFIKPDKWFKIWFFLVNRVNYKDNKQFKRGECFTTYSQISEYTKATKNQIDQFIRWAKKNQMLTTQKTTRGMTVFIVKYDEYQTLNNYKNDTENEIETKQKRNRNDTIKKNDKKEKKEKNIKQTKVCEPFIFDNSINKMLIAKDKRMPIIAHYWQYKNIRYTNKETYTAGVKRELRPSKNLIGYDIDKIKKTMFWLNSQNDWLDWTLETVHKFIDKDINKLKQQYEKY